MQQRVQRRAPRTEVACVECRARKQKCDGSRPSCTRCQNMQLECAYNRLPAKISRNYQRTQTDIIRRVEQLEMKLHSAPDPVGTWSTHGSQSDELLSQGTSPGLCLDDGRTHSSSEPGDLGPVVEDNEAPVDLVATDVFDEDHQENIVHFGSSSNHAAFRFLSTAFSRISTIYIRMDINDYPGSELPESTPRAQLPHPLALLEEKASRKMHQKIFGLPTREHGTRLLHQFFSSIGVLLPYISSADLLERYERAVNSHPPRFLRVFLVLLNMAWAHASSSLGNTESEVFYHRAIGLLNLHTLQGSSYDLIRSLLLLVLFQQNHQRSISSYTTHAMCVKAAFQIGLHMASDDLEEQGSRRLLWAAVVNNDRVFSLTQGRPLIIRGQSGNLEWGDDGSLDLSLSSRYFIHLTQLNSVLANTIDGLYHDNYKIPGQPTTSDLICKRHHLFYELEQWRDHLSSFGGLMAPSLLAHALLTSDASTTLRTVLSLRYYQVCMALNLPLLSIFLQALLDGERTNWEFEFLRQNSVQAIHHDWRAVTELYEVVNAAHATGLVGMYALHYLGNYTSFTATLHLFIILLIQKLDPISGLSTHQIQHELDECLSTLRAFERTSLMTWKARRCIRQLLLAFNNLGDEIVDIPSAVPNQQIEEFLETYTGQSISDVLRQCSRDEILDSDLSFMELYANMPLCE